MVSAVILIIPNIWLESSKWRTIIHDAQVTWTKSLRSVLSGYTLAIITPFRSGDYIGRSLYLTEAVIPKGALATFLSSLGQSIATLLFGGLGLIVCSPIIGLSLSHFQMILFSVIVMTVLVILFLNYKVLVGLLLRIRFFREKIGVSLDEEIPRGHLFRVIILSLIRYLVYLSQYVLTLKFLASELDVLLLSGMVTRIFLLQSLLPLPALLGFVARAEIAVLILASTGMNELLILFAALVLWVMNHFIPAIIGLIFILQRK